jgi:hypothetical protein
MVLVVVNERYVANCTLANYLGLHRVTLSSVLLIILEAIHNLTVYTISGRTCALTGTHARAEARCDLSLSRLTEPSRRNMLLLLDRGIVVWGCSGSGEAVAKRGTRAMIVASEKCILEKRADKLMTF